MTNASNNCESPECPSPRRWAMTTPSLTSDDVENGQLDTLIDKTDASPMVTTQELRGPRGARNRSAANMIQQFLLETLLTIPAVCFLIYGIMVRKNEGMPVELEPIPTLQMAAIYSPTIFPIAFAAIAANLFKAAAAWKMERGVSILSLEYLLSCRTVFSALTTPLSLRQVNVLAPLLIALWALSPLGGQAAVRIMDVFPPQASEPWPFECLEFMFMFPYSDVRSSAGNSVRASVQGAFVTALSNPADVKAAPRDLFGNVKIPMVDQYQNPTQGTGADDGWYKISPEGVDTIWSSIMGIPVAALGGLSKGQNYTFDLQTAYINADCALDRGESMSVSEWYRYMNLTERFGGYTTGRTLAIRSNGWHSQFHTAPMELIFTSFYAKDLATTNATCSLTTKHAEVDVGCHGALCAARRIRQLQKPENRTVTTVFDGILPEGVTGLVPPADTFRAFMSTFIWSTLTTCDLESGREKLFSSPIQTYFTNPDAPYAATGIGSGEGTDLYPVGAAVFSQRLTQLLNTFWLAAVARDNITGNFHFQAHKLLPETENMLIQNLTGTRTPDQMVMRVNRFWVSIMFVASVIMLLSGIAATTFGFMRRGPDVLDRATFFLRDSPYVNVAQRGSLEDGITQVKRTGGVRVCIGDVRSTKDTGYVASETAGEAVPLSWQERGRDCA